MSHAAREHKEHAPRSVAFAIVTVSDSRDLARDESGGLLAELAQKAGHRVARRTLVRDEPAQIQAALREALAEEVDAILFTGGTGVARRDVTVETLLPRFAKHIAGFGELFRSLSFASIGSAAMASRAEAGVIDRRLVFLLPGSPDACRLAMERLILPEVGHLAGLLRR
ncbi:MAG TPA: molybdenum cofactor biosynthesis protein B [Candidatus Thermoplasmatota archaeon]|nr:molybdenum cofactor biosynthesis protein B [Candidatus Thermoplasmatota archaeon]